MTLVDILKLKDIDVTLLVSPEYLSSHAYKYWIVFVFSVSIQHLTFVYGKNRLNQKILSGQEPLFGEIKYEKRRILGQTRSFGILYDGFHLQEVFREIIPSEERGLQFVHIFFANHLFATWGEGDRRYHLRTNIYGMPSLISTTGLVEAPAKPRKYYLLKQQYERLGKDLMKLKHRFEERFIDYEDKRLAEVAKGYAMKAVFCALTGDPFCGNKVCRLYNAHRQEEVIGAQLGGDYQLCPHHQGLLDEMRRGEAA